MKIAIIGYGGMGNNHRKYIIPRLNECLSTGGAAAVLVKPQFEAGRDKIGKNGVVRDKKNTY